MSEELTIGRFRELADAYGGVIARWPEQHKRLAGQLAHRPEAAAILAEATALDGFMDAWLTPAPSRDLAARITATMSAPSRDLARRARLWWSGIGIAAALAGAAAGTTTVVVSTPTEANAGSTSFGDVVTPES